MSFEEGLPLCPMLNLELIRLTAWDMGYVDG